jgi:hypothetical protein
VGRLGRGTAVVLTAAAAEARAEPETHERLVLLVLGGRWTGCGCCELK